MFVLSYYYNTSSHMCCKCMIFSYSVLYLILQTYKKENKDKGGNETKIFWWKAKQVCR